MEKTELLARVKSALEETKYPVESIEGAAGLQWFMALSERYHEDFAVGEMFFASDVTEEEMNGIEVVQMNAVFKRGFDAQRVNEMRAFLAKVNRQITGGRFDVQEEEVCFAEYGHDIILPLDLTDDQAEHAVVSALGLLAAYVSLVYEGVTGIADGVMTAEDALGTLG